MAERYPAWIDDYAKAIHQAFANMVPCSWGPVDVITLTSYLNGTYVAKVYEAIKKLKEKSITPAEAARTFSNLSTFRIQIWYLFGDYISAREKQRDQMKEIVDYLMEGLRSWAKEDMFALEKNVGHDQGEINEILDKTNWHDADSQAARELGKLYNSLASLAFALYRDFFPQEAHEIYGPYDVSQKFGDGAMMVVKQFSKIKPVELWPQAADFQYDEVKILQVFRGVKFKCEAIGMHSIYEGDLINGLVKYAAFANGQPVSNLEGVKQLNGYFEKLATEQSQIYDDLSHEELVAKALEWLCYQFNGVFEMAGMDWRPTEEMKSAVSGKKISDRFKANDFPSFDEFVASKEYEVYWLKEIYGSGN